MPPDWAWLTSLRATGPRDNLNVMIRCQSGDQTDTLNTHCKTFQPKVNEAMLVFDRRKDKWVGGRLAECRLYGRYIVQKIKFHTCSYFGQNLHRSDENYTCFSSLTHVVKDGIYPSLETSLSNIFAHLYQFFLLSPFILSRLRLPQELLPVNKYISIYATPSSFRL